VLPWKAAAKLHRRGVHRKEAMQPDRNLSLHPDGKHLAFETGRNDKPQNHVINGGMADVETFIGWTASQSVRARHNSFSVVSKWFRPFTQRSSFVATLGCG
jgi:hypothetical protein